MSHEFVQGEPYPDGSACFLCAECREFSYAEVHITERPEKDADSAFEVAVTQVFENAKALTLSKNRDYGPRNIADSPGGPLMGLAVRLSDKMARLRHLLETGATPENESLVDTFRDILGYGAIGVLVLNGDWPGVEES